MSILFKNLKSKIKHECLLHFSNDGQFNVFSISIVLSQCMICLAQSAQHNAVSSPTFCMDVCWCGSQIEEQYSMDGKKTNNFYMHVLLNEMDNGKKVCVKISVDNLLYCKVS